MPERMRVIAVAAAALVSSAALAQTAERPDVRVGDQWRFVVWYSAPSTQPNRFDSDWHFKPKGSSGRSAAGVTVVAHEKVAVPVGEFDAFKLTSREELSGTSPIGSQYGGAITRTYWYAPAARAIVKSVTHNPYQGPSTVELVSFERRP